VRKKQTASNPGIQLFVDRGVGAIELAARYEQLRFGSSEHAGLPSRSPRASNILASSDRVWTAGVNWYVNSFFQSSGEWHSRQARRSSTQSDCRSVQLLDGSPAAPVCDVMRNLCSLVLLLLLSLPLSAQTAADFFNDKILHEIRIDIFASDWAKLRANPKDKQVLRVQYALAVQWAGYRSTSNRHSFRGTGSRSGVKPGLRVDFDRYESKQQFVGLKSFILRNNTQDTSMMHEFMSMALMRRMGLPALREAFVKLYINDEYFGLYTIVENAGQDVPSDTLRGRQRLSLRL